MRQKYNYLSNHFNIVITPVFTMIDYVTNTNNNLMHTCLWNKVFYNNYDGNTNSVSICAGPVIYILILQSQLILFQYNYKLYI